MGIRHIAFSRDGKRLAASGMDSDHSIAVFDVISDKNGPNKLNLIATGSGSKTDLWSLGFNPAGTHLVAAGTREVNFYFIGSGMLTRERVTYNEEDP